jgi:lysophospholipase L1-like esterase
LTVSYLEKLYGAEIASYNAAVGGWTTAQGAANMATKVTEAGVNLADVDLFVIAFGMNDPETAESEYTSAIKQMINAYYKVNPNGSVLLVSPMQPNTQSKMVAGNQSKWESALNKVKNSSEYASKNVALAKVHTMFSELLTVSGKLSRDYLGNNINHPNDFGMRIYAQVVLKTLCGDDFS